MGNSEAELMRKTLSMAKRRIAELEKALRQVPILRMTEDALGWQCVGCGSVCGCKPDGESIDEDCKPGCWVAGIEAVMPPYGDPGRRGPLPHDDEAA